LLASEQTRGNSEGSIESDLCFEIIDRIVLDYWHAEYNWLEPEYDVHQRFQPAEVKAHTSAKTKAPASDDFGRG
jgi:hypothetical protein